MSAGPDVTTSDAACSVLFGAVKQLEYLPPTSDALHLHIMRCHFQVCVCVCVGERTYCKAPAPEDCGWKIEGDRLVPVLMALPAVPKACPEMSICGCKGQCNTRLCRCRKSSVPCMKLCS